MKTNTDDWNDHWGKQNELAEYNPGQILRHRLVFNEIEKIKKEVSVLVDFGSGQGDLIKRLSPKFNKIKMIGLENSEIGIEISKLNNPVATFYLADLTQNLPAEILLIKPDLITCCEVMEHVDKPELIVKNAHSMLKLNGYLIVTLPGGPMTKLDFHIGHRKHYDKGTLTSLLRNGGFDRISIICAGWPFFNLYRLMLLARGDALVGDVSVRTSALKTAIIKILGLTFACLFNLNFKNSPYGWQMIAIARK
jgi:SAM-dependent methyltransferase